MGRIARATPAELVGADWPEATAADAIGEVARRFAVNLREAIGGQSVRSAAAASDVDHTALLAILAGRSWPDLATIAKLERGLGARLWPVSE